MSDDVSYYEWLDEQPKCKVVYGDIVVDVKYTFSDIIYYAYKKKNKWVLRKSKIDSFHFTNMLSYELDNGWIVWDEDKMFKDIDEAIEFCMKHNEKDKIKIYNKDSWR